MHMIIIMLIVVVAALLSARMLPDEAGVVRLVRWTLFAIAGAALLLMLLTFAVALFE